MRGLRASTIALFVARRSPSRSSPRLRWAMPSAVKSDETSTSFDIRTIRTLKHAPRQALLFSMITYDVLRWSRRDVCSIYLDSRAGPPYPASGSNSPNTAGVAMLMAIAPSAPGAEHTDTSGVVTLPTSGIRTSAPSFVSTSVPFFGLAGHPGRHDARVSKYAEGFTNRWVRASLCIEMEAGGRHGDLGPGVAPGVDAVAARTSPLPFEDFYAVSIAACTGRCAS